MLNFIQRGSKVDGTYFEVLGLDGVIRGFIKYKGGEFLYFKGGIPGIMRINTPADKKNNYYELCESISKNNL